METRRSYWFALLLIAAGIILLLQNFNIVTPTIWSELFLFWPVVIIIFGLESILGRSPTAQFILAIITTLIIIAVLMFVGLIPGNIIEIVPPA